MSFPRAKIQRFNDVLNNVPSPTKYDPKLGEKVKGGCILKGETKPSNFSDTGSASSSKSVQPPAFRTPQLPKRHNCLGTAEKMNPNVFKSISFKSDDIEFLHQEEEFEELKALRVECSNKTETIVDMEKHIQELKTQISEQEKAKAQLEAYIAELETAKSNLECIRDNERCEKIISLQTQLEVLENKIEEMNRDEEEHLTKIQEMSRSKEEHLTKIEECEKKNNRLEELNLDFERKIISLEGTIEQLEMETKNKEKVLAEFIQKEEIYKMNHNVTIECLQGKISTLENEMKELDSIKSKNEAIIFGLETEISSLNAQVEKLKSEKNDIENSAEGFRARVEKLERDSRIHKDTITGLEMELEIRVKELEQFRNSNAALSSQMEALNMKIDEQKNLFEEKITNIIKQHEEELKKVNERYEEQQKYFESKSIALQNSHAEEVLQLQNDYESKLLAQMQENTEKINLLQCQLDEKEENLKEANIKYVKMFAEWENKLQGAETKFSEVISKLESNHLETIEELKESYSKKIEILEANSLKTIDKKNKEIDVLTEQYKEILGEVKELLKDLEKKDSEIQKISGANNNLNSRVKLMLEEIKLLNQESEVKTENLKAMTTKYSEEFKKNELLSCKLGELDCEIAQLKEDLNIKVDDWKKTSEELRKSRNLCDKIQSKKFDLETIVGELQEKVKRLMKELNERKATHEEEIKKANEELSLAKNHCKKFEIVMGNTRQSLEAVRKRLIESENEVEKLNSEKSALKTDLVLMEEQKDEFKKKYEDIADTKTDLEAALDEYLSNNNELTEKCTNLEFLCDEFKGKIRELTKLNEDLEKEKRNNVQALTEVIRKQELQLIETERDALDHVEKVSKMLTEKLEFFMKFSTEKVQNLTSQLKYSKKESEELKEALKSKKDDYDNLVTDYEILKTTVEIAVKESENLKKRCEDQNAELNKVEENINELTLEKTKMEEALREREKEYSALISTYEKLSKEVQSNVDNLEEEKERRKDLERAITDLKYKLEEKAMAVEYKEEEIKTLEKKFLKLELKLRETETDIASCQGEKLICIQEIQNLTAEKEQFLINIKIAQKNVETTEKLLATLKEENRKVEEDKEKFETELKELKEEKCKLEVEFNGLKEENRKMKERVNLIEELEAKKNYYKGNCLRLDNLRAELIEENASLSKDFNEIHKIFQERDKEVEELRKRCSELENLIGPFREQLEQYENERLLIENDREQLRKQHLEQAAKLGHQNHKQKIQHVVKLKNTLLETRKENEKLLLEVKNLKKKVQKLQEELGRDPKRLFIKGKRPASTPFKGKENTTLLTPSAGMITPMQVNVKQEPMSPGSPLRNRNQ